MGFNLPAAVASLLTNEPATNRALQSIKAAVDPLLQIIGSTFEILADGTLKIKRNVTAAKLTLATLAVDTLNARLAAVFNGPLTANNGITVAGTSRFGNLTYVKGSLIVQQLDDGTQGGVLIQGNQSVNGNSTVNGQLNTATGVKTSLGQFGVTGNFAAGAYYNLGTAYFSNNSGASMPYAGSFVGAFWAIYTTVATTINTYYTGFNTGEVMVPVGVGANAYTYGKIAYTRGTYPFSAGNVLVMKAYSPVTNNGTSVCLTPIVEFNT